MLEKTNEKGRQSLWGFPRLEITWILNTAPKQVTHVRIYQKMSETAAYSSRATEDQHVVKMTNPVKA